jgi:asparagine synthase (glutamine-hydrolysing)
MRDRLSHRGPDDAGVYESAGVMLGHRRLSVIDPGAGGRQPMSTADGRFVIVYNGELYNDAALRRELEGLGVAFRSSCDTETVLHAFAAWGEGALRRMRGMFALAVWDSHDRRLTLARDPLGIKPLYWAEADGEIVFASETRALFAHPGVPEAPDPVGVLGYVTTVRTTLGERTMFRGVRAVRAGACLRFECSGERAGPATESEIGLEGPALGVDAGGVRAVVEESVRAHLRSDVPWCCLLSGGLDSTVIATLATREAGRLRTFVSGCREAGGGAADDFAFAREAAGAIGSEHREVPVDRGLFLERWAWMVERQGTVLSTPNEVAIYELSRALRGEGCVVTLSGEGADELFGGYDLPLASASRWVRERPGAGAGEDGDFALESAAWMAPGQHGVFLRDEFAGNGEGSAALRRVYREAFAALSDRVAGDFPRAMPDERRMQCFLRMLRRFNLAGLLQRLDSATMLASVEGRTPFADGIVCAAAEGLGMRAKFVEGRGTKIALREAFAGAIPSSIVGRPKRSFPLPFEGWLDGLGGVVRGSGLVRDVYSDAAVELVWTDPGRFWNLAWPMANLALWGRRW